MAASLLTAALEIAISEKQQIPDNDKQRRRPK
jgi:hypothetical protein